MPENAGEIQEIRNEKGQFVPGISGNPAGKPKGQRSFTTKVREALEKIADGKDYTYEEAFIKAIMKKSIVDQNVSMMRTVWEQLDGKPLQRIANADGSNLSISFDPVFNKRENVTARPPEESSPESNEIQDN